MNCVFPQYLLCMVLVTVPYHGPEVALELCCTFNLSGGSEHLAPTASAAQDLGRALRAPFFPCDAG